mgnify:CR=1 FL=1
MSEVTGEPIAWTGVDGCGAPLLAYSLTGLARAFGRLVTAEDGDARRVADAMRAHPWLVAGTGREDTVLMEAVPGLLMKGGAEGVHAFALADGTAVALKIADGNARAREPILVEALRLLGETPTGEAVDRMAVGGRGRRRPPPPLIRYAIALSDHHARCDSHRRCPQGHFGCVQCNQGALGGANGGHSQLKRSRAASSPQ